MTRLRLFSATAALALVLLTAPAASAQGVTWYDQCGGIDTWYPQAGIGFDFQWHPAVYPVTIIETLSYTGPQYVYDVCQNIIATSNGRYAAHNHNTRPWEYMALACSTILRAGVRVASFIPFPLDGNTTNVYESECVSSGGTFNYNLYNALY